MGSKMISKVSGISELSKSGKIIVTLITLDYQGLSYMGIIMAVNRPPFTNVLFDLFMVYQSSSLVRV
jgi:hypothetical protein